MDKQKITINQEIALVIDSAYTIDDQIAIIRQKDEKPEEYTAFFAFCEEVKRKVKASRKDEPEEAVAENATTETNETEQGGE